MLFCTLWSMVTLKGVFTKNERGYRFTAKNRRFWSLLILLLSVASIRRKLLKTTRTEERSVYTNSERWNIQLWSKKKSILFQTNHSDITNNSHRLFFDAFINSWYFIMPRVNFNWFEKEDFKINLRTKCVINISHLIIFNVLSCFLSQILCRNG